MSRWRTQGPEWLRRIALGVAAGFAAQALLAFWRWLRAPALGREAGGAAGGHHAAPSR
jgi:hypothetical protein